MDIELPQLTAFRLECHKDCDNTFILDLSQLGKLEVLEPINNVRELHINTENLTTAYINLEHFSAETIALFLTEIHGAPVLKTLVLKSVRHPPDIMCIADLPLRTLRLCCICVVLDLSQLGKLEDIDVDHYVRVLKVNTKNLKKASINLKHFSTETIASFLKEIQEAPVLKVMELQNIRHPPERMDIALPELSTLQLQCYSDCDNAFILDLSQLGKIENLDLGNKVRELHINTENLKEAFINFEYFSTETMSSFLREIQGAPVLKALELKSIKHPPDRMDFALPQLTTLQLRCHSNCNSTFILDLSQLGKLENIELFKNVRELHINNENLMKGTVNMEHFSAETISYFLSEINGAPVLKTLVLKSVRHPPDRMEIALPQLTTLQLQCHNDCDNPFILDLSQTGKLEDIDLDHNVREFHINAENLRTAQINLEHLSAETVSSFLNELQAPVLKTLVIKTIGHPQNGMYIFTFPLLTQFELWDSNLGDSILTFSSEMTRLTTIKLNNLTVTMPFWRQLFLSIGKLPQHLTVELKFVIGTAAELREILFNIIGKLQKVITVSLIWGTEEKENLINILSDIAKSGLFSRKNVVDSLYSVAIEVQTIVT